LSCHAIETDVPLVMHGRDLEPGRWPGAVSGLDIVPTMLELMDIEPVNRLDGTTLPLHSGTARGDRPLVSYGFCSDSVIEGDIQLVWWLQGCRLRNIDDATPVTDEARLWSVGRGEPLAARPLEAMRRHEAWVEERVGSDTLMFDTAKVNRATVVIDVAAKDAVIADFGPASTIYGLDHIRRAVLSSDRRRLTLELDGYTGLYHVSTFPPNVPVRVRIEGEPDAVHFVGPMQLPLPSETFDPELRPTFFFTSSIPERRDSEGPAVRLWWHRFPRPEASDPGVSPSPPSPPR
jgi:hypothetical protein